MTTSYRSAAKIARESSPDFTSSRSCTTLCHGVQANFAISLLLGYYHVYYHYKRVITMFPPDSALAILHHDRAIMFSWHDFFEETSHERQINHHAIDRRNQPRPLHRRNENHPLCDRSEEHT